MSSKPYYMLAFGTALALLCAQGAALAQSTTAKPEKNKNEQAKPADGVIVLQPLVISSGNAGEPPATGTVGQPPAPYAGGQVGSGTRVGLLGNRSFLTTPFNVTGYTSKLIEDQQVQTLGGVVLNDPSVRNDAPPFSERDSFFIRGFSVTGVDTAYDGLFYIANPRRSFMEGIERVEILKGPSALLNGGVGRVGGTINLIPKRAGDEPLTRLTTGYMSDSQFWTHADLGRRFGPSGEWGVRLNGSYRKGDTALDENDIELGVAALGVDYQGERLRASFDLNHSTQNITAPTSLFNSVAPDIDIPGAPDPSLNTAGPLEYIDSEHNMVAGRIEFDLLPETTIYAAGGASRYREHFLTSSYQIINANGDALNTLAIQPQQIQGFSGEVGLRSKFQTGFIDHQLNVSASQAINENYRGGWTLSKPLPGARPTNIYDPVHFEPWEVDISKLPKADDLPIFADNNLRSIAVSDTLSFADDRFQLTLGGRYQDLRSRAFNTRPGSVPIGKRTYLYEEARFSPSVAAVWSPTEKLSFYGNYIEALTEGPSPRGFVDNLDEVFPPVVNKQMEVGVKYDLGTMGVSASLFEIKKPSEITTPGPIPGAPGHFSADGLQVNRGVELTVFGEPFNGFRVLGGVTFIDAELTKTSAGEFDGNVVPGVAKTAINLYGEYDLPWLEGLTLTGRMIYTGSTFYDQANTQKVDDWTRVDAGLRYSFERPGGKPIVIKANIQNLFDSAYWASSARGFLAVGAPRTFTLSATFDF